MAKAPANTEPNIEAVPTHTIFLNRPTGKMQKHPLLNNMETPEVVRFTPKVGQVSLFTEQEIRDVLAISPGALKKPGAGMQDFNEGVDAAMAAAAFHGSAAGDAAQVQRAKNKGQHILPGAPEVPEPEDDDDL